MKHVHYDEAFFTSLKGTISSTTQPLLLYATTVCSQPEQPPSYAECSVKIENKSKQSSIDDSTGGQMTAKDQAAEIVFQ